VSEPNKLAGLPPELTARESHMPFVPVAQTTSPTRQFRNRQRIRRVGSELVVLGLTEALIGPKVSVGEKKNG
jgi:hypothetical protein